MASAIRRLSARGFGPKPTPPQNGPDRRPTRTSRCARHSAVPPPNTNRSDPAPMSTIAANSGASSAQKRIPFRRQAQPCGLTRGTRGSRSGPACRATLPVLWRDPRVSRSVRTQLLRIGHSPRKSLKIGAPERSRTPNPQIRSLVRVGISSLQSIAENPQKSLTFWSMKRYERGSNG